MPSFGIASRTFEPITVSDLDTRIDAEPRILDLKVAERLEMADPHDIRRMIEANRAELETYGSLMAAATNPSSQGGRPGREYWLNEGQALCVCALSRTPRAPEVRRALIEAFMELRRGRHLPKPPPPPAVNRQGRHRRRCRPSLRSRGLALRG